MNNHPMQHTIINLELDERQKRRLKSLNQQLSDKLEKSGPLQAEWMADLNQAMSEVLDQQAGFEALKAAVRNTRQTLHLTHADNEILNLPWRLATESLPLLELTKGQPTIGDLPLLEAINPPLKILVMIASPEDSDIEHRLSYEKEEDQIIQSFKNLFDKGQVQIDFTDDGSLDNLKEKIKANKYHIIHFSGHGIFQNDTGYLELEDPITMNRQVATAEAFAQVFQEKPEHMPGLVVLASCQTAKGHAEKGMHSVADELLAKKVPAVIAMSVSVKDYFATFFAGQLYEQLAEREPLNRAFQRAIKATYEHEQNVIKHQLPSQWMIPQLLLTQRIDQLVNWEEADDSLQFSASKFVMGQQGLQQEKKEGYRFIGRRRDRKRIFPTLLEHQAVLLKGQGGVGKTAMAEYLIQRLIARDNSIHPFVFNETNTTLTTVIKELESFLEEKGLGKLAMKLELNFGEDAQKHLKALLFEVEEHCKPIFVLDNLESFQPNPGGAIDDEGVKFLLDFFLKKQTFLILTCRYTIAEAPNIPPFDLNQVSRNDFLKKALQLHLKQLPRRLKEQQLAAIVVEKLTFSDVMEWLFETFGGNYRALEFFDKLYANKEDQLGSALKTLATFKETYKNKVKETRQQMSKNLLFKELLKLLDETEKQTLQLLSQFRIPVLLTALQMQQSNPSYPGILANLQALTLLEKRIDPAQASLIYYYVPPLNKDLIQEIFSEHTPFAPNQAGKYHQWMDKEVNDVNYLDLEEAVHFFQQAQNQEALNETANELTAFYYRTAQYKKTVQIGMPVYELHKDLTNWDILNRLGMTYHMFGQLESALHFFKICEQKAEMAGNQEREGTMLNNMATTAHARGDYETALGYLEQSLAISRQIGDKSGEYTRLHNMAIIAYEQEDYNKYFESEAEAYQIALSIDEAYGVYVIGKLLGRFLCQVNNIEQGLQLLERSLQIGEASGLPDNEEIRSYINQYKNQQNG